MLTEGKVIEILTNTNIPKAIYSSEDVREYVLQFVQLTLEDKKPYVATRDTAYSNWHHVVQQALYHLSQNGKIKHLSRDLYEF